MARQRVRVRGEGKDGVSREVIYDDRERRRVAVQAEHTRGGLRESGGEAVAEEVGGIEVDLGMAELEGLAPHDDGVDVICAVLRHGRGDG